MYHNKNTNQQYVSESKLIREEIDLQTEGLVKGAPTRLGEFALQFLIYLIIILVLLGIITFLG